MYKCKCKIIKCYKYSIIYINNIIENEKKIKLITNKMSV